MNDVPRLHSYTSKWYKYIYDENPYFSTDITSLYIKEIGYSLGVPNTAGTFFMPIFKCKNKKVMGLFIQAQQAEKLLAIDWKPNTTVNPYIQYSRYLVDKYIYKWMFPNG